MLWKRLKILWWNHKFWFITGLVTVVLIVLTIIGLSSMESFFAQQIIGQLPLELLKVIAYSAVGALFYVVMIFRYGSPLPGMGGGRIKGNEVKVTFNDVIGLTEAKRDAMEVVHLIKDRAKVKKIEFPIT